MSKCKQTNPYAAEDHHTCTVRSSQYHLFHWSYRNIHQFRSDLWLQSTEPTYHLTQPRWDLAFLCWCLPKGITWAAAGELLRWDPYKGSCLLLFLKLHQVLLLNLCITLYLCLQLLKQNIVLNHALQLPHFTVEIIYTKLRHFLTSKFI